MYAPLLAHISRRVTLDEAETALLTPFFEPRHLKRKELFLRQGDVARYEAYLIKGCMQAFYTDEADKQHVVRFALDDWWVSDIVSFNNQTPSLYTIEAVEDCDLLVYSKAGKEALLTQIPKLEKFFRIRYQTALMALQRRITDQMSRSADERYAELMAKFPQLEQRLPQHVIASYLGITPQHLSRIKRRSW